MSAPTFEVLAFRCVPVTATVVVLELEGRFHDRASVRLGRPALLVEVGRDRFELLPAAAAEASAGPAGLPWRASFAASAEVLDGASFALEVGRDLLVDLPAPDLGTGDRDEGERLARLAREGNDLRRRLDEAALALAEAEAAAEAARVAAAAEVERATAATAAAEEEAARSLEAVRAQSDLLLTQVREEAEAAQAAERERHEREVAAVREQANHSLATSEDEARQAIDAVQARADGERERHERELAAVREQADRALATALRDQREQLAAPSPESPTPRPAPGALVSAADAAPQPAERVRPSTSAARLWRREPRVDDPATEETKVVGPGPDEPTRVRTARAPAAPTARRPGPTSGRREPQRIGALIALAVAIVAFVLVVVLRVGPF